MIHVYKVPPQFIDFLRTVVGTDGERLNLDVTDIDGNTIVGQEEWECPCFDFLKEMYPDETALFELIEYKPKPVYFNP